MEERLRLIWIEKYGPGSEKLSDAQLELLELEPGVNEAEVAAESERAQLRLPLGSTRKHPGRQELPADLPREEQIIPCSPEQCVCGKCGKETTVIGYETSEQLDVEPAQYFVRVTKREKRACKTCEEQGVQCALLPPRIIEKGLASDRVVIDTVVSKYVDYLPLYRQSVRAGQTGGKRVIPMATKFFAELYRHSRCCAARETVSDHKTAKRSRAGRSPLDQNIES